MYNCCRVVKLALMLLMIPVSALSQEILTPCGYDLPESHFGKIIPLKQAFQMSIYYEMDYEEGNSSYVLYYDELNYDLVVFTHNSLGNTTKEYRCQILRYPFDQETPASAIFNLVAAAVYSSSYCAGEIKGLFGEGDLVKVSYRGYSAFSNMSEGNCLELKSIVNELVDDIKNGNKDDMYALIPKMKSLTEAFRAYYPIPAKHDDWHKIIPALR